MAGLDHAVHPSVRQDHTARYGCHNSPGAKEGYWAPNRNYRVQPPMIVWEWVENRFSRECRYDLSETDMKCEGCKSVGLGRIYDEDIRRRGT